MIYWLGMFVVLLLIEIATVELTTIWFAGGTLVAFLATYLGANLVIQIVLFLLVSILLLVFTRPIAIKYFNSERHRTNADRVIGQKVVVKECINSIQGSGKVEINGMEWSAKAEQQEEIQVGTVVVVKEIQGVKVIVEKEEE